MRLLYFPHSTKLQSTNGTPSVCEEKLRNRFCERHSEKLGVTKGALYKHYRNKRDIFDSIVSRMKQRVGEYGVPEGTWEETPDAYRDASIDCIVDYAKAQFLYWTEDGFAAPFRKMLTLEQYGSAEMGQFYQQYLVSGPLGYMADLFAALNFPQPQEEAVRFYAPMFLLYSVYDGAEDKRGVLAIVDSLLENARKRLKGANAECG